MTISIGNTLVCDSLNLNLSSGEIWAVIGANGRGKTTLLNSLAGLYPIDSGQITINDQPIKEISSQQLAKKRGILFQHQTHHFPTRVIEYCLNGLTPHKQWWQWETSDDVIQATDILKRLGLEMLSDHFSNQLSGGEQQRLALARLMLQDPNIWLLDEPTSHLDINYQIECLNLLKQQAEDHQRTMIISLHDINLIEPFCSHILMLFGNGETCQGSVAETLNTHNLSRLYQHQITCQMIQGKPYFIPALNKTFEGIKPNPNP